METKKLGFGTMRLPLLNADDPKSIDLEQFKKMADIFLDRGFCYFDTAYPYHGECSEIALKKAVIERYPRERLLIADKMPILRVKATEDYQRFFDEQLKRCGTDYFDFYLLHNMGRDRYIKTQKYGGFDFIQRQKEKGYVRKIGFSFHDDAATLDHILSEHPEVDFVQLQINYLDWEGAVAQSRRCYETAEKYKKDVFVMEPVKGGTLAVLPDKAMQLFNEYYKNDIPTPASLAVRYAASLERVKVVLSGMSNLEQLENNTSYMQDFKPVTAGEKELINKITDILNSTIRVPCTGCRYCLEEFAKLYEEEKA